MSTELADLIAKRFIARADAKAWQKPDGSYAPVVVDAKNDRTPVRWSRDDLVAHLDKSKTFGHYMIDPKDNTVKLFAFDIDFEETGLVPIPNYIDTSGGTQEIPLQEGNPRELWRDRSYTGRAYLKMQLHYLAHGFVTTLNHSLGLDCAVAYSGNKGLHVYAFTGRMTASDARDGALIALEMVGGYMEKPGRASTWVHAAHPNCSVEVYPKQTEVEAGSFGNLMRLPLGRHQKSPKDPTFFVDMTGAINSLDPIDPLWALGDGSKNPFKRPGE